MDDEARRDDAAAPEDADEVEARELTDEELEDAAGGDPPQFWGPQWQGTGGH